MAPLRTADERVRARLVFSPNRRLVTEIRTASARGKGSKKKKDDKNASFGKRTLWVMAVCLFVFLAFRFVRFPFFFPPRLSRHFGRDKIAHRFRDATGEISAPGAWQLPPPPEGTCLHVTNVLPVCGCSFCGGPRRHILCKSQ